MKYHLFLFGCWLASLHLAAQPDVLWQKNLGGSNSEFSGAIFQTPDSHFFLTARTISHDGDVGDNHGIYDFWAVKLDADGQLLWEKALGGSNDEKLFHSILTADGGLALAGYTFSNDGDVAGHHQGADLWVVKLDSNGGIQWQKTVGGTLDETAYTIRQTADGGYILSGATQSNNGDVTGHHGDWDAWVIRLDAGGNLVWQKTLGGTGYDHAEFIEQVDDGGFILCAKTASVNGDVAGNHGGDDIWVVRLAAAGNILWKKCFGGSWTDVAHSFIKTDDGGFLFAGSTYSTDGDISGHHGGGDVWVVKLSNNGNPIWKKCLGGSSDERALQIRQTPDGGYIFCGDTFSGDGDVSGMHGTYDAWVVKLDGNGDPQWKKTLGGSKEETLTEIILTDNGGYAGIGFTNSSDGDASGDPSDGTDLWVVKLSAGGQLQWQKKLGGSGNDFYRPSIIQTADKGYALCTSSESNDGDLSGNNGYQDVWVVRFSGDIVPARETRKGEFSLFISPNPSNGRIRVSCDALPSVENLRLINPQGEIVWNTGRLTLPASLELPSLPGGVYLLTAFSRIGEVSGKLVVQRR